jgi:hypothetical protein
MQISRFHSSFDARHFRMGVGAAETLDRDTLIQQYVTDPAYRRLSPNPCFSEEFYLATYPDVRDAVERGAVLSGFLHFVQQGIGEGRIPNPTMELQIARDAQPPADAEDDFDEVFYRATYPSAVAFVEAFPFLDLREFYLTYGWRMHHCSNRESYEKSFLGACIHLGLAPDVNPPHRLAMILRAHFDEGFYAERYASELEGLGAFEHYLTRGMARGNAANRWFDENFYLAFYPDVRRDVESGRLASGFEHYLHAGHKEGRLPRYDLARAAEHAMPGISTPKGVYQVDYLEKRIEPPPFVITDRSEPILWFLLPTLNPDIFFGGYTAVLALIEAFLSAGHRIGLLLCDAPLGTFEYFAYHNPDSAIVRRRSEIEIRAADEGDPLPIGRNDVFFAYSAWQAYWAHAFTKVTRNERFVFFIQEYEPIFHHHDAQHFLVASAYDLPHFALINSAELQEYLRVHEIGVFASAATSHHHAVFTHAHHVPRTVGATELRARTSRHLALYARPEHHASRNLFEIAVLALRRCVKEGLFDDRWRFTGIGSLSSVRPVPLGGRHVLSLVPKVDKAQYEEFLRSVDLGLSLMYAPHPSLVPYEMASAGAIVLTNTFENRSAQSIEARDPRLIAVPPRLDAIVDGLARAIARVEDVTLRTTPTDAMPRSWAQIFHPGLLERVLADVSGVSTTLTQIEVAPSAPAVHGEDLERPRTPAHLVVA